MRAFSNVQEQFASLQKAVKEQAEWIKEVVSQQSQQAQNAYAELERIRSNGSLTMLQSRQQVPHTENSSFVSGKVLRAVRPTDSSTRAKASTRNRRLEIFYCRNSGSSRSPPGPPPLPQSIGSYQRGSVEDSQSGQGQGIQQFSNEPPPPPPPPPSPPPPDIIMAICNAGMRDPMQ